MSAGRTPIPRAWFAMYPGDYIRDTGHLSLVEHGAYWCLLLHCYSRHEPFIPHDRRYVIAHAVTSEEQVAVDHVLGAFFQRAGETWHHNRVEEEIGLAQEKYLRRSICGQRGAEARWQSHDKPDGNANPNAIGNANSKTMANDMAMPMAKTYQSESQPQSPSHPPAQSVTAVAGGKIFKDTHHASKPTRQPQGQRLPTDWQPCEGDIAYGQQCGLDVARTSEDFRDYWLAESGQRARKVDWSLAWRRWCRNAAERARGGQRGNRPSSDDGLVAAALKTAYRNHGGASESDPPAWER